MGRVVVAGLVFLGGLLASLALVPLARALGHRLRILDEPGERKVHRVPTPRTGGWAVALAFLGIVVAGYLVAPALEAQPFLRSALGDALALLREAHRVQAKLAALMAGAAVAFAVGLADDVMGRRFPPWAKAAGQVLAAVILVTADVRTQFLPSYWLNALLTVVWLVGMTNAFNLLDNMDGLSAGVAATASLVLLVNAWSLGEYFVSLILLAFVSSLLGFLVFNFHPASIFLGDSGSHFIGYTMGALTLLERYVSHASSTLFPVLMPVLVLAVPIADTASVVVIRLRERRPIYVGDQRHLSHRLVALGFSQRSAVVFLYVATFSLGLGAASLAHASLGQSLLVLLQCLGFLALTLWLMFHRAPAALREEGR